MKRSITLICAAAMLSMTSSCSLFSSLLKIPAGILTAAGRTAGLGLTDEKPQPEQDQKIQQVEKDTPVPANSAE